MIGLGVVAAFGQAPLDLWWLTIPALAIYLWLASAAATGRAAFGIGFWFGLGYFAFALRWIVAPFLVHPERDGWMAPFAMVLMAAGAALFWAAASWGAWRALGGRAGGHALGLWSAEVLRSLLFTGFPWALLGHVLVATPLAQAAAYGGPHMLTGIVLALAVSLCLVAERRWAALAGPVAALAGAVWLAPGPAPVTEGPVVRLVQPNAPQDEKWDPEKRDLFFERMVEFTGAGARPDLVVWPETAIPALLEYAQPLLVRMAEAARGAPLVTGANRSEGMRYYNAFAVIDAQGAVAATYDKAHLVPFGEYIPFGEWLQGVGLSGLASSTGGGFSPGTAAALIDLPGIGPARALICYEGIFAEEIDIGPRPRLMVLITNDAWFGEDAGPYQHLAQARLRAIEQGLPMVRVANTGVSAMIDGKGRLTAAIPLGTAGAVDAMLPPALDAPPYVRWGDAPVLILLLSLTVLVAAHARRQKRLTL